MINLPNDRNYKCLDDQQWQIGDYTLSVIRDEDKHSILKWRNEQLDILRQNRPLSQNEQELYFREVVAKLFTETNPEQLLFSYFFKNELIGYGGLVHINWKEKSAEISFLTQTERNDEGAVFRNDFANYLSLVTRLAFQHLGFQKLHTTFYAIPQRSSYRKILSEAGFTYEGAHKEKVIVQNEQVDQLLYSLYNRKP